MVIGQTFSYLLYKNQGKHGKPLYLRNSNICWFFDLVFLGTRPDLNSIFGGLVIVVACITSYRESVIKKT